MTTKSMIFVYGPPGVGKTTVGKLLAEKLDLPFYDLDGEIEAHTGRKILEIFASDGEAAFRQVESERLTVVAKRGKGVIALGGGALLDPQNRACVEAQGEILLLRASLEALVKRVESEDNTRPLLNGKSREKLSALLQRRKQHYDSFSNQLDVSTLSPEEAARQAQIQLGAYRLKGMGSAYDSRVIPGGLDLLGKMLKERGWQGRAALVCDDRVGPLYADRAAQSLESNGFIITRVMIPSGEEYKTIETVGKLWAGFLEGGLERGSTVIALGGGVVSDLAGFAASTYLRGVRWICVPTTLLAMADASLGGKTGADLPQGKNLIGTFYPPALVLADPQVLWTLPEGELRSGLAEVVKHGVLMDQQLFDLCAQGWDALASDANGKPDWGEIVRRAMGVKIHYIETDPYEKGIRAALNLGHTIGHALERASNYGLRHGEAVSIGMVLAARLAERMGLSKAGLADQIAAVLAGLGLPVHIPATIERSELPGWMKVDKKRSDGVVRFALPVALGDVRVGLAVDYSDLQTILEAG